MLGKLAIVWSVRGLFVIAVAVLSWKYASTSVMPSPFTNAALNRILAFPKCARGEFSAIVWGAMVSVAVKDLLTSH